MEIERKFLIKYVNFALEKYEYKDIEQSYLSFKPEKRIRKANTSYFYTEKSDGELIRSELEKSISETEYEKLSSKSISQKIKKRRYLIPLSKGQIAELDVFSGNLEGLILVEVEFQDSFDAENFNVPEWFGEEVTYNQKYKNKNLAQK